MFSVCVCVCLFLCVCVQVEALRRADQPSKVLPTVPDQETEETQPYAPKAGASSQVWEQRGRKKKTCFGRRGQHRVLKICLMRKSLLSLVAAAYAGPSDACVCVCVVVGMLCFSLLCSSLRVLLLMMAMLAETCNVF
jgi:hypothetical protein